MVAPFLLPSGRLFAPTGTRLVNHVVFCLFAGGIRNLESVHQKEGNLMPLTLSGSSTISQDILGGMEALPGSQNKPIQHFGTLFKEFRYNSHQTVHYNGHASAITGTYANKVQMMMPPPSPTVFEFYRKHNSPKQTALNAWWVTDQGGPFPFLNYSQDPDYGPAYGANILQPSAYFNSDFLQKKNNFSPEEKSIILDFKIFLDRNQAAQKAAGIFNNAEDRERLILFSEDMLRGIFEGNYLDPYGLGQRTNEDMINIFSASKILSTFQPELLIVNMQDSDIGHSNFTQYCNNMRKADFALSQLWNTIQTTPKLKDDTILIVAPEFGRNSRPNTLIDAFGRFAVDHTGDESSKEIFCLIAGPENVVMQNQVIQSQIGETIDIVPTIAHILGFKYELPGRYLRGNVLREAFV